MHVTPARRARYFWGNIPGMRRYANFSNILFNTSGNISQIFHLFMDFCGVSFGSASSMNRACGVCAELGGELHRTAAAAFYESL